MPFGTQDDPSKLEKLSAMVDGELDSATLKLVCGSWRDDAAVRSTWHAYHLIGDVLRSDDLASTADRDSAFIDLLRAQLAVEPVVLAPAPAQEPRGPAADAPADPRMRRSRWGWMAPSTVAAGFVLVAGALMATRSPTPSDAGAMVAGTNVAAPRQAMNVPALAAVDPRSEPQTVPVTREILRDSRLDRYLAAHQQFAGATALGVPSGFLRNAAAEIPLH